jgi:hypothetical protein
MSGTASATEEVDCCLADTDTQAETMLPELVKQMAQRQGVTEAHKATYQMIWPSG